MSRDGYLPDNVRECDLPGEGEGHYDTCPAHEDAPEIYSECGGEGVCVCYEYALWGTRWMHRLLDRINFGEEVCIVVKDPECKCADIADDEAASAADAAEALREDR